MLIGDTKKAKEATIRIYEFLDEPETLTNSNNAIEMQKFEGNIEFKNVAFKYPTRNNWVFKNLNLKINAGEKVALVGQSGKGKSTIIQLLLRFYDVNKGQILIDGKDIKEIDIQSLRSLFGLVSQEPFLFNNTIRYNICYNKYDCSDEEI